MKNTKYRDAITGEKIDLKNRIVHDHDLDDYTGQAETFFHPLNQKGWIEVNEPRSGSGLGQFFKYVNPQAPDRFTPSRVRCAENCGSALTHRLFGKK